MRVGRNPLWERDAPDHFPPVLATVITHLPNEQGYHAKRAEVVWHCLETMRAGAGDVPVLVWDNGSHAEFRDWLTTEYKPDYLILSPNVGKDTARAALLRMVPPDTFIALTDDDMEFFKGWLDASLKIIRTFPNVGAVSAYPVRFASHYGIDATLTWANRNATVERGRLIPEAWERDWLRSIGHSNPDEYLKKWAGQMDYRITYGKAQAYAGAQHCQFLARAGVVLSLTHFSKVAMGSERPFDEQIDAAGLLRLCTVDRYSRHMGNVRD